ncbi:hypothetical protein ACFV9E_09035 [Streptomyces sp. NPDC059835]|uniref:hypothetical protein n=1 Tax=Streptomyces sp. NPDC059835 TaxID=3346967 RepID=UPI00365694F7
MNQKPFIRRPITGDIEFWGPYVYGNRQRIQDTIGSRCRIVWEPSRTGASGCVWRVVRTHMKPVLEMLLDMYGEVVLFREYRETDRCDTRCLTAEGDECVCGCMGLMHGSEAGGGGWLGGLQVGDHTVLFCGPRKWARVELGHSVEEMAA